MPRLKPIDFANFDDKQGQRMLKDILMKYPRGPMQNQRREDYGTYDYGDAVSLLSTIEKMKVVTGEEHTGAWHFCRQLNATGAERFGYTPDQVYTFFIWFFAEKRPDAWNIRDFLRDREPGFGKAKLTRSANRIKERLWVSWETAHHNLDVVKMFKFSVRTPLAAGEERSYYSRRGQWGCDVAMVAPDQATAEQMVRAIYGHCIDQEAVRCSQVVDWKGSDECDVVRANQHSITRAGNQITQWKEEIQKLQEKIANVEFIKESIELYSVTAFEDA